MATEAVTPNFGCYPKLREVSFIAYWNTSFQTFSNFSGMSARGGISMMNTVRIRRSVVRTWSSVTLILLAFGNVSKADVVVTVDPGAAWQGFMNVFELDRTGPLPARGNFVFPSGWGFNDLTASFDSNNCLVLGPNTIGDPDPFWYIGGGGPGALGNKWMDANGFVQNSNNPTFSGVNVTFAGIVKEDTLTANHTARAFIRDFAPDFSSFNETSVVLDPGLFSITLATIGAAGRHVQYGFNFAGENVWVTDAPAFGTVKVGAIPEPSSLALVGLFAVGAAVRRRRVGHGC